MPVVKLYPYDVCDFCSTPEIEWAYTAETFTLDEDQIGPTTSIGNWAACAPCAELIEQNQWNKLADRSLAGSGENIKTMIDSLGAEATLTEIKRIHRAFRKHRKGGRYKPVQ